MHGTRAKGLSNRMFGLVLMCGLCGGALAFAAGFHGDAPSQLAAGSAADMQCMGGKDAMCECHKGIDKKTGKCGNVPGGGKIGCPCQDTTSGHVTSGKCEAVGKCKGEKTDGMMPMLPMLPMMMPKMMMMPMMMQPSCPPTSNATTSSSTSAVARDPSCPPDSSAQASGNFWGSAWDSINPFSSPDDSQAVTDTDGSADTSADVKNTSSVWGNLMKSLGISNDTSSDTSSSDTDTTSGSKDTGASEHTTGSVTSKTASSSADETHTETTIDFAKTGSTFTYEADDEFDTQAATVLDQIKKTLEKLLAVVSGWL